MISKQLEQATLPVTTGGDKGTVVMISVVHWHFTWQTVHYIASGLAERGYRVLFIEPLPKRWPRFNEFGRMWGRLTGNTIAAGFCEQPLIDGVELISPRLLPDAGRLANSINKHTFVPQLVKTIKAKSSSRPLIVINYLPISASVALMEGLEPDARFYHCVNDWSHDPYAQKYLVEAELAKAVDMVWADSTTNIERTSKMHPNVVAMPKGVDTTLFAKAQSVPETIPEKPLCVFFGMISVNTDIDLLRFVSHRYPLRLVGPIRRDLSGFSNSTEIIGSVPHDQVPEYIKDADVLLLPYSRTAHSEAIMPAKLFECLATGKPAIVSGLKSLDEFEGLFYFCDTQEEFIEAIDRAILEPKELRQARIASAEQNSYSQRLNEIESYFTEVLTSHRAKS